MTKAVEEITQSTGAPDLPNEVHILDDFGHVSLDPVVIRRHQEVVWKHHGKQQAQISFKQEPEGVPFSGGFVVGPGESKGSGLPKDHAIGKKKYKYTVNQNDPVVIIDP